MSIVLELSEIDRKCEYEEGSKFCAKIDFRIFIEKNYRKCGICQNIYIRDEMFNEHVHTLHDK